MNKHIPSVSRQLEIINFALSRMLEDRTISTQEWAEIDYTRDNFARLIASAPELLESLKMCEQFLSISDSGPHCRETLAICQEAITKAEGGL